MKICCVFIWALTQCLVCSSISMRENSRQKRTLVFPFNARSLYGIFLAIAVPLDIPEKNVFISYNFEANYYLPHNVSELGDMGFFAPITEIRAKRELSRRTLYSILEDKLSRSGFKGRPCLLRIICEASLYKLHDNGVLGNILHIIFTPSTSTDEELPINFYAAEKNGNDGNCVKYFEECSENILNVISKVY